MLKKVQKAAPLFTTIALGISILAMAVGFVMFMLGASGILEDLFIVGPIVFGAGLIVYIDFILAVYFYTAATDKGYRNLGYLYIPFFLTIAGYLLVIALPDRGTTTVVADDELPEL